MTVPFTFLHANTGQCHDTRGSNEYLKERPRAASATPSWSYQQYGYF